MKTNKTQKTNNHSYKTKIWNTQKILKWKDFLRMDKVNYCTKESNLYNCLKMQKLIMTLL